jgi:hypothetical protein
MHNQSRQEVAAGELVRVCRPAGKIGLANWTPESFIGELFKTIGKYVPPAPDVKSPAMWGSEVHLNALFGRASRQGARLTDPARQVIVPSLETHDYFISKPCGRAGPVVKAVLKST